MVPPHRRASGGLEPAGRSSEPAGMTLEPVGRALESAGRALEPPGMEKEGESFLRAFLVCGGTIGHRPLRAAAQKSCPVDPDIIMKEGPVVCSDECCR